MLHKKSLENINDRLEFTDIGYSTSFSEAPAKSVFSVYERVIAGRKRAYHLNELQL